MHEMLSAWEGKEEDDFKPGDLLDRDKPMAFLFLELCRLPNCLGGRIVAQKRFFVLPILSLYSKSKRCTETFLCKA